jgi:arylsulfatase A-like enzyme
VLLVTFDALRADRLGTYGSPVPVSPHLDALAARSAVFTRALSQSASTIASVPSLHTGKYAHLDLLLADGVLRPSERTLAELLAAQGYATAAVISNPFAGCRWGFCRGFATSDEAMRSPETAAHTAARARRLLRADGSQPFFLWVHFLQPHAPYLVSEAAFRRLWDGPRDVPTFFTPGIRGLPLPLQLERLSIAFVARGEPFSAVTFGGRQRARVTPTVTRQLAAMYDGSVAQGDRALGRLLAHVAAIGAAGHTVVVVGADHGESLGEGSLVGHNRLWYRTLHTPLVVHVPGAAPSRSERPVMNVDVLPTVLDVLGLPPAAGIRGTSVFADPPLTVQYAESSGMATVVMGSLRLEVPRRRAVPAAAAKLYDWRADPDERHSRTAEDPAGVQRLLGALEDVRARSLALDPTAPDTDVRRKLQDLGYIQ